MAAPYDADVAGARVMPIGTGSLNGSATLMVGVGVSCVVNSSMTGAGDSKSVEDSGDGVGSDGVPSAKLGDIEKG